MGTSSIVRTPGDYVIFAPNGGVVIDVNNPTTTIRPPNTGTVTIYGNLDVIGGTTFIETTNTNITDNILVLNNGETANYVSLGTAGLLISRSVDANTGSAATFLFNDTEYWQYDNLVSTRGIWELNVGDGVGPKPSAIRISAIRIGGQQNFLNLFGQDNPNAMLNVRGTLDYETRVNDDDDIPNKKYVDEALYAGTDLAKQLKVLGTTFKAQDNAVTPVNDPYYNPVSRIVGTLSTETNIVFELYGSSARIQGITIDDSTINANTTTDLVLQPLSGYAVQVKEALKLGIPTTSTVLTPEANMNTIYYTGVQGGGGTGLYYVNSDASDELVSRRRAIIYGIIF